MTTTLSKYWYLFTTYYCPVCGHTETIKERQYTLKPENVEDRHKFIQEYDRCYEYGALYG